MSHGAGEEWLPDHPVTLWAFLQLFGGPLAGFSFASAKPVPHFCFSSIFHNDCVMSQPFLSPLPLVVLLGKI